MVEALDQYYETPGLLLALWELATNDKTQFRERYRSYLPLEAEATSLWHFAVSVLPGLLQTPGYARGVLAAGGLKGEELEQQVDARMGRRELLDGDDAPSFRTILSEAVLRTPLRDAGEWRRQLEYLTEAAERPNATLHVLPFSAGPYGLDSTCSRPPAGRRSFPLSGRGLTSTGLEVRGWPYGDLIGPTRGDSGLDQQRGAPPDHRGARGAAGRPAAVARHGW